MGRNIFLSVEGLCFIATTFLWSCGDINSVGDPHFTRDGALLRDSTLLPPMEMECPTRVKVYVEVSGSMNGFFRANRSTMFKADVWNIISSFSNFIDTISILTDGGDIGADVLRDDFQPLMNAGAFVSTASTRMPVMLRTMMDDVRTERDEVGVLISDMKYDPVGGIAPDVLLSQYSADISRIVGGFGKAVCLIGATSDYLSPQGHVVADRSPYYFFVIGEGRHVAFVRNCISTLLDKKGRLIDNIESGFDYGATAYSFGIPRNCSRLSTTEPTFCDYDPTMGPCTIRLKIPVENYRWIMADPEVFARALQVRTLYGSKVEARVDTITVDNHVDRELKRRATATVTMEITDMPTSCDVVEWRIELPDTDISRLWPYMEATSADDVTKTYSLEGFLQGIFHGGVVNKRMPPHYILVSKNS